MGFEENWLKEDKVCEKCGQVTERQKGLTKQNLKRLLSVKFDINELIITFIIIMVLLSAYAYKLDTQTCRNYVKQTQAYFLSLNLSNEKELSQNYSFNLSIITITNKTT